MASLQAFAKTHNKKRIQSRGNSKGNST